MDRETLLGREDEAWSALVGAFDGVPDDRREVEGVVPGWSVKDLVWHCGYWADYVGDVLERMSAGQPEPPDQDWEALNRMVAEDGKAKSWGEVIVAAERGRDRARAALIAMTEVTAAAASEFTDAQVDPHDRVTDPDRPSRPRVFLERLGVRDLDQHPEAARVEPVDPSTAPEVVDRGARHDRDPVDPTGVLGLVDAEELERVVAGGRSDRLREERIHPAGRDLPVVQLDGAGLAERR